jgi:hypothetical protein
LKWPIDSPHWIKVISAFFPPPLCHSEAQQWFPHYG